MGPVDIKPRECELVNNQKLRKKKNFRKSVNLKNTFETKMFKENH